MRQDTERIRGSRNRSGNQDSPKQCIQFVYRPYTDPNRAREGEQIREQLQTEQGDAQALGTNGHTIRAQAPAPIRERHRITRDRHGATQKAKAYKYISINQKRENEGERAPQEGQGTQWTLENKYKKRETAGSNPEIIRSILACAMRI